MIPHAQFSKRTKLRYLHCIDQMYNHTFKEHIAEDYWHPPSLELVGYGPQLYPIRRDPVSGTRFTLPFWDYTKVQFRTVHEFDGCEDSEWLLRGHGWAGPGKCLCCCIRLELTLDIPLVSQTRSLQASTQLSSHQFRIAAVEGEECM